MKHLWYPPRNTFEFDDYPIERDRTLGILDRIRKKFPHFKCTIFAIPKRMTEEDWKPLEERANYIQVAPHGLTHRKGECRYSELYESGRRMRMLQRVANDPRYVKLFKPPWYGISGEFAAVLHDLGFAMAVKHLTHMPYPLPADWKFWCINDAEVANGDGEMRAAKHVLAHPLWTITNRHTRISRYNVVRWQSNWTRRTRWSFSIDFVRQGLVKLNLGCENQVWNGWLCLDPRARELNNGSVPWSFDRMIPVDANKADVVFTSHVFEFVPREKWTEAMLDIWRVLRPGAVWRLTDIETERYRWRGVGARTKIGVVRSEPTEKGLREVAERVGFKWHQSGPGRTMSPHKDVLQGDSRSMRLRKGHKFYAELVKPVITDDLFRYRWHDPRAPRYGGRYRLPEGVAVVG